MFSWALLFNRFNVTLLLAGVALGGWGAWQVQAWRQSHKAVQQIEQQARDTLRQINNRDRASAAYQEGEADADKTHTQIVERVRIVNARPAAAGQCLDADGLRELAAAIDNAAPTTARPGRPVPTAVQAH
jgi:hypothetical protein